MPVTVNDSSGLEQGMKREVVASREDDDKDEGGNVAEMGEEDQKRIGKMVIWEE